MHSVFIIPHFAKMENGCVLVKENKFYYTKTVILVIIEKRV